jgi:pimeloyl-ACP methyl ester carboxylesterase
MAVVNLPTLPPVLPIWRESRVALEWARLRRSDAFAGEHLPAGDGRAVLLIPGFLAGDSTLSTMGRWLATGGWRPEKAGIRANVACSGSACTRLEERLEVLAAATGQRVAVVGHSRGGVFAKALGARRPDLVSGVVALGSPLVTQLALHPILLGGVGVVGLLGTGKVPGMFSVRCLKGSCCAGFRDAVAGELPAGVGFTSVYSRSDGVVDWHACLDPAAECVEVDASHCGMGVNLDVYEIVARALGATLAAPEPEPARIAAAA